MFVRFLVVLLLLQIINVHEAAPVTKSIPWPNQRITYSILNNSKNISPADVKTAFRYAFDQWSAVIPRDFIEIPPNPSQPADIQISFTTGDHGDGMTFDGPGGELSHASTNGIMHIDGDDIFKRYSPGETVESSKKGINWLAMHDIGHILGLGHNRDMKSIMAPIYNGSADSSGRYMIPKLSASDIKNIQDLYGAKKWKK